MNPAVRRWLFWTPRVLTLLFAAFISLFALDVFGEPGPLAERLVGFAIHMIPTALVLVVLAVAWRWEWIGALVYLGLGVFYIAWSWGRFGWDAYLAISGPLFLVGLLFLVGWRYRAELRRRD